MKLAIIPARGGSKRIPRKNILPFCGKPMIAYAIEAAQASGVFDRIVVSTDDEEIAATARAYGAETPFTRPPELADDYTPTVPVIAHAILACRKLGWETSAVCCIYPATPLLQAQDIHAALELLDGSDADYAFTVTAFPSAIQRALRRSGDGRMQPFYPEYVNTRTQDLEPAYYDAGQFYWGKTSAWLQGISPHKNGLGLAIPNWRVADIDTQEDWVRAEMIYRFQHPENANDASI
jgi:pseudaminic acid cytidylyltransferase